VAIQAGITRQTLHKIESGVSSVTIGSYLKVLNVFGLNRDVDQVAGDSELRRQLREGEFLLRERAPRRQRANADEGNKSGSEDACSDK